MGGRAAVVPASAPLARAGQPLAADELQCSRHCAAPMHLAARGRFPPSFALAATTRLRRRSPRLPPRAALHRRARAAAGRRPNGAAAVVYSTFRNTIFNMLKHYIQHFK